MVKKAEIKRDELDRILNGYSLGKIIKIAPLESSGNISYLVKTDKKTYFLRLSPLGMRRRSRGEIAAEIELLHFLKKRGFPVILPVKSKKGGEIVSWKNHYGYLREFMSDGAKLSPSVVDVYKLGRALGRLHALTENFKTKNVRRHKFGFPETRRHFQNLKKEILKSNLKNRKEFVMRFEKEISALKFPPGLPKGMIHEDLGRRHVLWRGSGVAAIIDFDRCYFGALILDLGQAARGWCFEKNWTRWNAGKFKALVDGYEHERRLCDIEKRYLIDAIKFGILERALSFCVRSIYAKDGKEDAEFARQSIFKQLDLIETAARL